MSKKDIKKNKAHVETVTDKIGEIAIHYGFSGKYLAAVHTHI